MSHLRRVPLNLWVSTTNPTGPNLRTGDIYYNSTSKTIRIYDGAAWVDLVNDETNQTIAGTKTFGITNHSSVNISDANTSSYFDPSTIGIFASSGTVAGYQWQVGSISSTASMEIYPPNASGGGTTRETEFTLGTKRWTGAASTTEDITLKGARTSATAGDFKFSVLLDAVERFAVAPTGVVTAAAFASTGLTGAVSASRYVGATASAAPVTGTFVTGDFVIAQSGNIFVCTAGGSPGTWTGIGGGSVSYATTTELANVDNAAEGAGASATVARGDHKHAVNSATAIALTGSAGAGTSTSLALADHQHGVSGLVLTSTDQSVAGIKTFSSEVIGPAATTSIPSFRAPHGTAPSSPTNGDIWTTTAGMYVRINGSTVGPLSAGGGSTPLTTKGDLFTYDTGNQRLAVGGTNGMVLMVDSATGTGLKWLSVEQCAPFANTGNLSTGTGKTRFYVEGTYTITGVRASVGTASAGQSIICDVNKNGTTIYTTQGNRPTIAAASNTATANTIDVTSLSSGDYLTVDIDQIGTTTKGADLSVQIWMRKTA